MKKIKLFLLLFSLALFADAQIFDPIKWETSVEKVSDNEYFLVAKASIEGKWHLYSQDIPPRGPRPTTFEFEANENYELVGKPIEEGGEEVDDPIFKMRIKYFSHEAVFKQKIKLLTDYAKINATVNFMSCNDTQCLPPKDDDLTFEVPEPKNGSATTEKSPDNASVGTSDETANKTLYSILPSEIKQPISTSSDSSGNKEEDKAGKSLWSIFGLGFLGGLLALLTPCVFPMIPLTVSFFTKNGGKGSGITKAVFYGASILGVYLLLSVPFHLLDSINPDILNEISTNVWLNIIFFVVFVFFAFSFFGFYELTLPSSWTSKTTKGESIGGFLGVFFMALTLAIVSFSCTGPILGSLLAGSLSSNGGAWQLTAGMGGFGVALGLPFALFAMFPNMLSSLPKSGGWLNVVKVVLGFLELALAFKFLSNADLVKHWGILKIEPFLFIWIVIFAGLALYLFGKIKFPHDSPIKKLPITRIVLGVLVACFTIYLASGFMIDKKKGTYKPLTVLSGLAPPVGYSLFNPAHCPNNLNCFKDLKEGLAYAKKTNKPIMIDFTGHACVNCRKMEEHVWTLSKIDKILRNEYVLISLYVDDKRELADNQKISVNRINGGVRELKNYGHKWSHFQTQYFQTNTQPYYVLLSPDGKQMLNKAVGYTPDSDEYEKWLKDGVKSFKGK